MEPNAFRNRWSAAFLNRFVVKVGWAAFLAMLVLSSPGKAQETGAVPPADRTNMVELLNRLEYLESRVNQLETKLNLTMVNAVAPVAATVPSPIGVSPSDTAALSTNVSVAQEPQREASAVGLNLRMFGDVGYVVSDQKSKANTFNVGSLDLFMTGSLSDRVSILGEVLFIPQTDNHITLDVERLLLQYKYNDYLTMAVGRYHSSIGYYNTA